KEEKMFRPPLSGQPPGMAGMQILQEQKSAVATRPPLRNTSLCFAPSGPATQFKIAPGDFVFFLDLFLPRAPRMGVERNALPGVTVFRLLDKSWRVQCTCDFGTESGKQQQNLLFHNEHSVN
ncbi:MAG TPA: hypothetical protein VFX02_02035, partial [Gammaproteobacteria bacterium]|nr:hypothetical protein [Gammaproteobacteria bacterium]